MNNFTRAFAALLCVGLWLPADARASGFIDDSDGMLDMSQYLSENRYGFLPIPVVITEPAIGYGGGLFGLFLHDTADSEASKSRTDGRKIPPAMSAFGGGVTQNGTWFVGGGHRHTWNNDGIRYLVALGYADINLDIYSGDIAGFDRERALALKRKATAEYKNCCFAWPIHHFLSVRRSFMRIWKSLPITPLLTVGYNVSWVRKALPLVSGYWQNMTPRTTFSTRVMGCPSPGNTSSIPTSSVAIIATTR
ncbi:hypothetical protein ACSPAH_01475 [Buttiauxella agrestis]